MPSAQVAPHGPDSPNSRRTLPACPSVQANQPLIAGASWGLRKDPLRAHAETQIENSASQGDTAQGLGNMARQPQREGLELGSGSSEPYTNYTGAA